MGSCSANIQRHLHMGYVRQRISTEHGRHAESWSLLLLDECSFLTRSPLSSVCKPSLFHCPFPPPILLSTSSNKAPSLASLSRLSERLHLRINISGRLSIPRQLSTSLPSRSFHSPILLILVLSLLLNLLLSFPRALLPFFRQLMTSFSSFPSPFVCYLSSFFAFF